MLEEYNPNISFFFLSIKSSLILFMFRLFDSETFLSTNLNIVALFSSIMRSDTSPFSRFSIYFRFFWITNLFNPT